MSPSVAFRLAVLACLASCGTNQALTASPRPNLLLILTDDQRFDTLGCTGNTHIETPNIDRLAAEGALFTRAYVTTSLCCPARASLLTGRYAHVTGIRNNEDQADFLADRGGFPEQLQAAGYETAFFGKWHIHNPGAEPQPGFDHWVSFKGQGQYFNETFNVDGRHKKEKGFTTDVLTDMVIEWLEKPHEKPFCLILSLKNLHGPYLPPKRHRDLLADVEFPRPESFGDPDETLSAFTVRAKTTLRNRPFTWEGEHSDYVRAYHLLMLSIDDNLGRIYDSLEKVGQMDRTAIVYTSDGGFMWGEHGLYRKRTAYEPSIHVPLLLRYPGEVPVGARIDRLALNVDLASTFLELAGLEAPDAMQGESLVPLWREETPDWRKDFLYIDGWGKYVDGPQELAVRSERYKYVRYRRGVVEEALFDLEVDPDERTNLAAEAAQAARLETLRGRMAAWIEELEAPASWMDAIPIEHTQEPNDGDR